MRPNCTQITLADGSVVYSEGVGSVRFNPVINGQEMPPLEFSKVLYVPALSSNLFSVLYLTLHCHFTVFIEKDTMNFIKNGKTLFQAKTGASNAAFLVGVTIPVLISDVVHLSGTYLIILIRIRLYLCRLDYILSMFLLYLLFAIFLLSSFGTPYCSSLFVHSFVLRTTDGLDLASRTFHVVQ